MVIDFICKVRGLVRSWYGTLPVKVLVANKELQRKIMEFESLCERKVSQESIKSELKEQRQY